MKTLTPEQFTQQYGQDSASSFGDSSKVQSAIEQKDIIKPNTALANEFSQKEKDHLKKILKKEEKNKNNSKVNLKQKSQKINKIKKQQEEDSYNRTKSRVQKELTPKNLLISNLIHSKFIESATDIIGNTIARPNALLFGSILAFILTLITYVTAKTIGFSLSGYETLLAFVIGWLIGLTYDYLRVLFTGKK